MIKVPQLMAMLSAEGLTSLLNYSARLVLCYWTATLYDLQSNSSLRLPVLIVQVESRSCRLDWPKFRFGN